MMKDGYPPDPKTSESSVGAMLSLPADTEDNYALDGTASEIEDKTTNPMDHGPRAWTVVAGAWCCLFCSFGWVFDNYGPKWLLIIGTFLHVFGLIMTSVSTEYYQFLLAQGICSPLGASFVFYAASACTATWFEKRRALAFGIMSSGSSLGGIVFPIMLSRLLPQVGFSWSLRVSALVIMALLIVANLTIRSRIAPVPRPVALNDYTGPFSELPFVLLTLASCCGFFAVFVPINYVILEAQEAGVNRSLTEYLLTMLNAARSVEFIPTSDVPFFAG
ncbi:hypothetical protein PRK78_005212 [Emydomyces testavorans]|uniref:Major facilitator superfamily (MFS) profile domain-containing protein n=1 Tax=Emydomyces testavorans TaxID=2070801 RepID=A0AAF0DJC8_9EURO|nr:hypothetical protein PRK78_005212 [Emydomyces testavorans]